MFCCTLHDVHSSNTIILMGKRELVALLNLSSWCLMMVERFFLAVPWGCLRFVIVVFPDHTHLLIESISISVTILLKLNIVLRKRAKISNQYNQAPHLPQDTNGKVKTSQLDITSDWFVIFITSDRSFRILKIIWNR